jgi:hypothetical protein
MLKKVVFIFDKGWLVAVRYKRDEAFRFLFGEPISAFFSIAEVKGKSVVTPEGKAKVIDLSPNGMRLNSSLDIPVSSQDQVKIQIRFSLNDSEYRIVGDIVWRKKDFDSFFYGIHFKVDQSVKEELIEELKAFSRVISRNG